MSQPTNEQLVADLLRNAMGRHNLDIISAAGFKAGYLEGLLVNLMHDVLGVRAEIEGRIATQLKMEKEDA